MDIEELEREEEKIRRGGGEKGLKRQHGLGRLFVRERLQKLLDPTSPSFEIGLWAAYGMYSEWGAVPAAGVVVTFGVVEGRYVAIIANDATVKAGAFFPQTVKKLLRAQKIARALRLPIIYLVDSAGVFLPLQEEIFPDEDDFGRIFYNNAVLSAEGIPQIASVMGNCIAGGGYLPVLCDQLLMTKGSGLYLAGPALVEAAIGQKSETKELGGATMHATLSGTVDYLCENEEEALKKIRQLIALLPEEPALAPLDPPGQPEHALYSLEGEYNVRDLLASIVDRDSFMEYKAEYGRSMVTGFASIGNKKIGIVSAERCRTTNAEGRIQIGGVIYGTGAEKAARFVLNCNQLNLPILFLQDVVGFMVGKEAEQEGIIRQGAKLVNAVSNVSVPKLTLITGNSFGAGAYALCGKAYNPTFVLSWPNARHAVMGASQAANTLAKLNPDEDLQSIAKAYEQQTDIRYAAARGWVDAIIAPHKTRETLHLLLTLIDGKRTYGPILRTGVVQ